MKSQKMTRECDTKIIQHFPVCNKLFFALHHSSSPMNIICIALLLCVICHVYASEDTIDLSEQGASLVSVEMIDPIANSLESQHFVRAVHRSDAKIAFLVFEGSDYEIRKYCAEHLVSLKSAKFVELINDANSRGEAWLLRLLLVHADRSLVDEVFDVIKPSNWVLSGVAFSADLACMPERFTYLLKKINSKENQNVAVRNGIFELIDENRTECLDPFLIALGKGTFLSNNLENVAIRQIFLSASRKNDDRVLLATRFFNHPAISAKSYSTALCLSQQSGGKTKILFLWLLTRADCQDLRQFMKSRHFSKYPAEFQQAMIEREKVIGTKTRHEMWYEEGVALMKKTLEGDIPTVLVDLIAGYYF